jgi:hypothetical protein
LIFSGEHHYLYHCPQRLKVLMEEEDDAVAAKPSSSGSATARLGVARVQGNLDTHSLSNDATTAPTSNE